ncbi:MAG: hypothetical protein AVDCRST_MAG78-2291 [uncultured Rubrobacteraceae bacterium]|uniref:Uncharacterized protein n=1 Tax=uncultured Rubrobacteraceae bacterium TaxID=349277 RepID=A0A6J4QE14_9ACTN|nr:MAG: hypothetical protein AVDCRST_MAG78-2291 [uncultured Rubrobacteraceae bacterium]
MEAVETITREELKEKMDRGDGFVLVETLPELATTGYANARDYEGYAGLANAGLPTESGGRRDGRDVSDDATVTF